MRSLEESDPQREKVGEWVPGAGGGGGGVSVQCGESYTFAKQKCSGGWLHNIVKILNKTELYT